MTQAPNTTYWHRTRPYTAVPSVMAPELVVYEVYEKGEHRPFNVTATSRAFFDRNYEPAR
jgi:hypothetical protein